jgi:DNA-binding transcriptional LysR family regulator
LRSQQPALALTVVDDHMQGLLPRLTDGEPDLAVVYEHRVLPEIAPMALGRTYLFDDAFHAVLPRGHKQARSGAGLDLPYLAGEAWVGGAWFRIVRHACLDGRP